VGAPSFSVFEKGGNSRTSLYGFDLRETRNDQQENSLSTIFTFYATFPNNLRPMYSEQNKNKHNPFVSGYLHITHLESDTWFIKRPSLLFADT